MPRSGLRLEVLKFPRREAAGANRVLDWATLPPAARLSRRSRARQPATAARMGELPQVRG